MGFTAMRFASGLMSESRRVGTGESNGLRSVPVGMKLAGGLLLAIRCVCTSGLARWSS